MKITTKIVFFIILIILTVYSAKMSGIKIYRVASSSMEPNISKGSLVCVYPSNNYKRGDVITYKIPQNKAPITHRILEIQKIQSSYFFVTMGDHNNEKDPYFISQYEVLGKVIFVSPFKIF